MSGKKVEEKKINQLQTKVSDIQKSLDELKNTTLSEADKKTKTEEIKNKAETTKHELQSKIDELKDKKDADSVSEKGQAETLLKTLNDSIILQLNIGEQSADKTKTKATNISGDKSIETQTDTGTTEEKGFFGKIGDGLSNMWNDVRSGEKRKEQPGKNLLYVGGTVVSGYFLYKGVKKLWNRAFGEKKKKEDGEDENKSKESDSKKKDDEKSEGKTSRRKKGLLWAGGIAGTVWGGTALYKNRPAIKARFKEKLGNGLTMEQSVVSATAEVRAGHEIDEDIFRHNFEDGIQYDAQKKTIKSYGYETPIDPVGKKLVGLDNVVFSDYKELIHAANITNCLKSNYHNRCDSPEPFHRTNGGGGDLEITLANGDQPEVISASDTNARAWIGGVGGAAVGGFLGAYCGSVPGALGGAAGGAAAGAIGGNYLDNNSSMGHTVSTIASGNNFQKYIYYLNIQKSADGKSLRPHENEQIRTDTPLKEAGKEVLDEILGTYSDNGDDFNRNLDIKQDKNNPTHFTIESYNEKVPLVIEGLTLTSENKIDYGKIKSIKIGKYKEYDRGNGLDMDFSHDKDGLKEAIKVANLTNKIRHDFRDKGGEQFPFGVKVYGYHRHLQIDDRGYRGRDVVYRETLSSKFPTLWQDLKQQINETDQKKLRKQAHGNSDQEGCGSKYIRYLHQMREQRGALSYWRHEND